MTAAEQLQAAADRRAELLAKADAIAAEREALHSQLAADNPRAERNLPQFEVKK